MFLVGLFLNIASCEVKILIDTLREFFLMSSMFQKICSKTHQVVLHRSFFYQVPTTAVYKRNFHSLKSVFAVPINNFVIKNITTNVIHFQDHFIAISFQ
jgi:hypothetical protein